MHGGAHRQYRSWHSGGCPRWRPRSDQALDAKSNQCCLRPHDSQVSRPNHADHPHGMGRAPSLIQRHQVFQSDACPEVEQVMRLEPGDRVLLPLVWLPWLSCLLLVTALEEASTSASKVARSLKQFFWHLIRAREAMTGECVLQSQRWEVARSCSSVAFHRNCFRTHRTGASGARKASKPTWAPS